MPRRLFEAKDNAECQGCTAKPYAKTCVERKRLVFEISLVPPTSLPGSREPSSADDGEQGEIAMRFRP
jgi:hypothetical protein